MKARFFALAALVLGLASCQNDFDAANVGAGGEVDLQLSVNAPELATRAGLDGVTPDGQADLNSAYGAIDYLQGGAAQDALRTDWDDVNLRYTLEVYDVDENGNLVGEAPYAPVKDRQVIIVDEYQPVTFELRLVPKRHYRFVVFADFVPQTVTDAKYSSAIDVQANIGKHHTIGATLADIKVKNDGINDECSDAYFGYENFTITNSTSNDIVLKRPYGKLRVIATDLAELNLNVNPKKVTVAYTATHLTNFDAVTGAATLDTENTEVEFDSEYNDVYKEVDEGGLANHFYTTGYDALEGHEYKNANGAVRHTHMTLFTDYILANNEVSPVHFTMTVYDRDDNEIKSTTFNTDIPVQRNYLTTVIGNVLTTATEVEVRIDDNFAGEKVVTSWDGSIKEPAYDPATKTYTIVEESELAWLAAAVNGTLPNTTTRAAGRDFAGETFILKKDIDLDLNGDRWTPIGATGLFRGTFDGNNKTIFNLFVSETGTAPAGLFADGICTIKKLKVNNAEIYGHHYAGVIIGNATCAKIENCHVENAIVASTPYEKNDANHVGGIAGYLVADGGAAHIKNCSVKNAEISGFRDVAGITGTASAANVVVTGNRVENVTVTADQTVEYVDNDKDGNAGAIIGRYLNTKEENIKNNTVGEEVVVIRKVDSTEEMAYAVADAQNGDTIYVGNGEVALPHFNKALNFVGEHANAAIAEPVSSHIDAFWQGAELNFTNLKINGNSYTGKANGYVKSAKETYTNCAFVNYYMFAGDEVIVEKSTFVNEGQYFWTGSADVITFNECKFNGKERAVKVCTVGHTGVERKVNFNNCEFAATAATKSALEIDGTKGSSYIVNINNCTETGFVKGEFTDMAMFNVEGADKVQVYVDGKKWVKNGIMEKDGELYAYNAAGLQYLLDNAVNGETVKIGADIEGDVTVTQKADVKIAIEGNNYNYAGVITVDGKSATYLTAGLTIKELNFKADAISADACIRLGIEKNNNTRYTCNVTVDSCIFDVPGAVGVKSYTGGDKNLKITNCRITANGHSLVQAKGIDGILVEKCQVYSKNGLNFNNSTNVTVDQCTTDVKGYAVRYGEGSKATGGAEIYAISNSTLKSACEDGDAVVVLRGSADKATLTITNTTLDGATKITNNAVDAKVIIDGKEQVEAASQSELNDAIAAGGDVAVTLADGNYSLPSISNGDVAISGGKDVVITITKPNLTGSDVTFTGVTVKGSGYATGVQHVDTVTYNNVTIEGEMCLYGAKNVFNECTFNLAAGQYIWTYGSDVTEFNNCTFNTAGKAILVYNEGNGACEVKVDGCKFYASAAGYAGAIANQACAAVEIDNSQSSGVGAAHKVTYSNTNTYDSNFSGGWRIKNYVTGNPITVNGVEYTQIAIDGKLMTIDADKNVTVQ